MWMAGAGIRGGRALGATDEFGVRPSKCRVDAHDVNATILRLLGHGSRKADVSFQGRDQRLTDVRRQQRIHETALAPRVEVGESHDP